MRFWNGIACIIIVMVALVAPQTARASATLLPGQTLEIVFSVSNPMCPGGPCDVLLTFPTADGAFNVVPNGGSLFNGTTLLGTHPSTCAPNFRASTSLFTTLNAATVDFTSINNGSISGRITFSIASGYMTWNGDPGMTLTLGRASGSGAVLGGTGVSIISSRIISQTPPTPTPLPGTVWLCLAGIGFYLGMQRLKKLSPPFRYRV